MKKTLLALAAAAAISPAAFADVTFKGDANVEGFRVDTEGVDDVNAGYTSRIRLAGTAKTDGNVSVNFRLLLNNSIWSGDQRDTRITLTDTNDDTTTTTKYLQGVYEQTPSDPVAVDYGYIQMPIAGWTVRAGRQVANWAGCFITCNENRDRLLAMKRFGSTTAILITDKRSEGNAGGLAGFAAGSAFTNDTATDNDSNMYSAAAVGMHKGWLWGLLLTKWAGDDNILLNGTYAIMPYAKGKIGGVSLEASLNYLNGGDLLFTDGSMSGFVRAGVDVDKLRIEGLAMMTVDGGLIDVGFDTYSMTIQNNPKTNASNTNVAHLGRNFGLTQGYDEYLVSAKLSGKVDDQFTLSGALGVANVDNNGASEIDYTFFNVKGSYQVAKTTEIYAGAETVNVDDGSSDVDTVVATLGVNTTF